MLIPLAFLLGVVFGWVRATRRGGNRLDKLQYAAVHGILFALLTILAVLLFGWLGPE